MNFTYLYFFLSLKNAARLQKEYVEIQYNIYLIKFLKILYAEGFILSYEIGFFKNNPIKIKIYLRFLYNHYLLHDLKILSKPSHKKYLSYKNICRFFNIRYSVFLSTSKGILIQKDCQKKQVGGKLLYIC